MSTSNKKYVGKITYPTGLYYYKGSMNNSIKLRQLSNGDIEIVTDFNEVVETITPYLENWSVLTQVIEDLSSGKYA